MSLGNIGAIRDVPTLRAIKRLEARVERLERLGNVTEAKLNPASSITILTGGGPVAASSAYSKTFSSATSWVITGAMHGLGTADLSFQFYDSATGTRLAVPLPEIAVNSTTYDVTITWATAQAGRVVIHG